MFVNTIYNTDKSNRGSKNVQIKPSMEFLYLTFRSDVAKSQINDLFNQN